MFAVLCHAGRCRFVAVAAVSGYLRSPAVVVLSCQVTTPPWPFVLLVLLLASHLHSG